MSLSSPSSRTIVLRFIKHVSSSKDDTFFLWSAEVTEHPRDTAKGPKHISNLLMNNFQSCFCPHHHPEPKYSGLSNTCPLLRSVPSLEGLQGSQCTLKIHSKVHNLCPISLTTLSSTVSVLAVIQNHSIEVYPACVLF